MKIYKASIQVSIFFVLQLNHSLSQSNFEIGFSADIYNIPISNLTLDLGTMERMAKPIFKLNEASYVDFIWWRKNNFGWFVGLGLHTYNYEARIKIPDPFDPSFPLLV